MSAAGSGVCGNCGTVVREVHEIRTWLCDVQGMAHESNCQPAAGDEHLDEHLDELERAAGDEHLDEHLDELERAAGDGQPAEPARPDGTPSADVLATIVTQLTDGDLALVIAALEEATEQREYRVSRSCYACNRASGAVCDEHAADIERALEYDSLCDRLRKEAGQ